MPVILAAAILWAVVMCQITMITAERMVQDIPENMDSLNDYARQIIWNSPNFTHGDPTTLPDKVLVQELGDCLKWWGFYTPFPDYTHPFLLDPRGFDWLPAELRYGYDLGMGLFTEDGVPLFINVFDPPLTGDNTQLMLLGMLCMLSAAAFVALWRAKRI